MIFLYLQIDEELSGQACDRLSSSFTAVHSTLNPLIVSSVVLKGFFGHTIKSRSPGAHFCLRRNSLVHFLLSAVLIDIKYVNIQYKSKLSFFNFRFGFFNLFGKDTAHLIDPIPVLVWLQNRGAHISGNIPFL